MAYQTFALKYRPRTFDEIVAQDHVATTLKNAVAEGRVAHGYLFAGPRGTGKTSTARVLAKALSCEHGPTPEPCCECDMCRAIDSGSAMDLIEIDAASNRGIDDIRALREKIGYAPTQARVKFYILDEAHMLTPEASNALLKTLEEPPEHAYFVLATTEPHEILPTIRSRCQSFEFRPIPQAQIVEALRDIAGREGVEVEEAALGAIARAANGAMRDAESIFDQVIAYGRGNVTLEMVNSVLGVTDTQLLASLADAVADGDIEGVFTSVDDVVAGGKDISQLLEDLGLYFRDLLRLSLGATPPAWMQAPAADDERMQRQAAAIGPRRLTEIIEELADASARLRDTNQQALLLEVTLAHLAAVAQPEAAAAQTAAQPEKPPAQPEEPATQQPQTAATQADEPVTDAQAPEAEAESAEAESGAPEPQLAAPPEPPEPVELPDGELTPDDLRPHYERVGQALRAAGHSAAWAVFECAEIAAVDGGAVTVQFPAERQFECRRAHQAHRPVMREALAEVFDRELSVICTLEGGDEQSPAGGGGEAADGQEQIVQELLLNFDGSEELDGGQ